MIGTNWSCPYCGHAQVLAEERVHHQAYKLHVTGGTIVEPQCAVKAIVCANALCKELSLWVTLRGAVFGSKVQVQVPINHWPLLPPSNAKPQPNWLPPALVSDYKEACAIRDLSPKASATIIRRCLQGMIRDFCGIKKGRLVDEIEELRRRVDAGEAPRGAHHDTVDAIDHVRSIGNIGAHMEKDIDLIIDVDPEEAQRLIELSELLFEEWYVARFTREQRLIKIGAIAAEKAQAKRPAPQEVLETYDGKRPRPDGA